MAAEAAPSLQRLPSSAGPGAPDNLSYILRIGRALLFGFIRSLFQQLAGDHPQRALVEQLSREDMLMARENVPDSAQVTSLREFMLHLWQELSNNPEISSMVQCVIGNNPLKVLAEVSETMFASGINWGRIVVFFYFAYRVIAQSSSSCFQSVLDWAMAFLRDHLAAWIQQQGGWRETREHPQLYRLMCLLSC
ncbi:apoptosis regulator BAX-like isoform X2 [Eublepharis macularius]|uniref:Apoptosis regulator BAX-like isoform X2 n=1 Tax=Eublepharis macularius TaxID=481883 RepID=A0AA97K9D4_EUBMA|nr:apoptosis regulator BAX-like isoform X2 [Eublepharis macularius]